MIFVTNHPDDGTLAAAINASGQVVVLDEDVAGTSVPKLFCDNEQGGYLAGRHLAEAGHRAGAVHRRRRRHDQRRAALQRASAAP